MWFSSVSKTKRVLWLVSLFFSVTLAGCSPSRDIPFESLSTYDTSKWTEKLPGLVIIAEEKDVKVLATFIYSRPLEELVASDKADLSTWCLIAVFQGLQGTGGYQIEVQNIQQSGKTIQIYAKFIRPTLTEPVSLGQTQPYHLVRIRKTDLSGQGQFTFVLIDDSLEKEVAKKIHMVQ